MRGSIAVRRRGGSIRSQLAVLGFAAAVIAVLAPAATLAEEGGSPIRFHSEAIRLVIAGDSLEVQGLYRFVNSMDHAVPLSFFFPFPEDSLLGPARMVSLEAFPESTGASFTVKPDRAGAIWRLRAPASDTLVVRGVYRQRLLDRYAKYIVTTTRVWQEPLVHARFEIVFPEGVQAPRFNYPFVRQPGPGPPTYLFEARSFLPQWEVETRWD